ncbi:MAG: glycosyltransferase family 2 protein [Bacillota bacterium]
MEQPIISIIIPVYKVERYLQNCIDSILNQSFQSFELILINDGSPDNCGAICDAYAKEDNRIKVIHKKNEGVSIARNTGINISKGKYIMFSDADDYVEYNWCEEMYNTIVNYKCSLVISGFYIQNKRQNKSITITRSMSDVKKYCKLTKKDFFNLYEKHLLNSPCNKIYISKIIKDNNIRFDENLSLGEDLLFNLDYFKKINNKILMINLPLYNYILRNSESLDNKYYENLFEIYKKLYGELNNCMYLFSSYTKNNISKFNNSFLIMLNHVLNNTFNKDSKLSLLEKIKYNNMILKSDEFKRCLEYANFDGFNRKYITFLKLENYFLIYIFNKLALCKKQIFNSIKL